MADKYTPERATSGKEWLRTWWKKVENNFTKIFGAVNKHIDGTTDRHTADMIDYSDTETVRAKLDSTDTKLDSTDTKLDTKVDKVSGKSLIDSGVADNLEYDTDKEELLIKVSEPSQGLRVKNTTFSESTKIVSGSITIESDASGLGNYLSLSPFGGIMINSNNENADVRLVKAGETHRLSQKVDKIKGMSLINENVADRLTYDSTNDTIHSSVNLLLENGASVAAYDGTFKGDIKIGQLGANKWAYRISPITGFSTCMDVTCTSGNVVHNLAAKADTTNVLTRNNTQTFTPTADYQPATKKYVDDAIKAAIEKYNTEAMALLGED